MGKSRREYVATPTFNPSQGSAASVVVDGEEANKREGIVGIMAAIVPIWIKRRREMECIVWIPGNAWEG